MRTDGGADGHTDMTKLIIVFRNFANVHNKHDFCKLSEDKIRGSHGCKQTFILKYDEVEFHSLVPTFRRNLCLHTSVEDSQFIQMFR